MPIGDDVLLTGEADAILKREDGSLLIGDCKTAFPEGDDDTLYPMYLAQLNGYAMLAEHHDSYGVGPHLHQAVDWRAVCEAKGEPSRHRVHAWI